MIEALSTTTKQVESMSLSELFAAEWQKLETVQRLFPLTEQSIILTYHSEMLELLPDFLFQKMQKAKVISGKKNILTYLNSQPGGSEEIPDKTIMLGMFSVTKKGEQLPAQAVIPALVKRVHLLGLVDLNWLSFRVDLSYWKLYYGKMLVPQENIKTHFEWDELIDVYYNNISKLQKNLGILADSLLLPEKVNKEYLVALFSFYESLAQLLGLKSEGITLAKEQMLAKPSIILNMPTLIVSQIWKKEIGK